MSGNATLAPPMLMLGESLPETVAEKLPEAPAFALLAIAGVLSCSGSAVSGGGKAEATTRPPGRGAAVDVEVPTRGNGNGPSGTYGLGGRADTCTSVIGRDGSAVEASAGGGPEDATGVSLGRGVGDGVNGGAGGTVEADDGGLSFATGGGSMGVSGGRSAGRGGALPKITAVPSLAGLEGKNTGGGARWPGGGGGGGADDDGQRYVRWRAVGWCRSDLDDYRTTSRS